MPGLKVYTSNRLEVLAVELGDVIQRMPLGPLVPETIIVQSPGMQRWVSMRLADRLGVWANCDFPFPNSFVDLVFEQLLSERVSGSAATASCAWKIHGLLGELVSREEFLSIRHYLEDDSQGVKKLQLATYIADLFDQYALFRMDMVSGWEKGRRAGLPEEQWQAVLWRELAKLEDSPHRASLYHALTQKTAGVLSTPAGLPARVNVFGISYLPPFHFNVLRIAARYTDVNMFIVDPCREYWMEIQGGRSIARTRDRYHDTGLTEDSQHLEEGNSLLAAWGIQGKEFLSQIISADEVQETTDRETDYKEPKGTGLLGAIQSDILNFRNRPKGPDSRGTVISPDDRSIQLHSCHSPFRELEVLHDNLLDMFERDPALAPHDIIVMTPDIETYSPFIQAVFEHPPDQSARIPFSIADRRLAAENSLVDGVLKFLALRHGRRTPGEVLGLLECPPVADAFGINERELELIRRWVLETRVCWGKDGQEKERAGLPPCDQNTWKSGLERLFLGYAMTGEGSTLVGETTPYDAIEGAEAQTLGKLGEFLAQIFSLLEWMTDIRPTAVWAEFMREMLLSLFGDNVGADPQIDQVQKVIDDLQTGDQAPVGADALAWWVESRLGNDVSRSGFLASGMTFCELLPMRAIPFKVVCLVGMNHDAYPRMHVPAGFDLISMSPRPGDRSRRNDDLYLFLEALLSARQCLYLSHVGRSLRDNSQIPPTVVVSSLLDYADQGFALPAAEDGDLRTHLTTQHHLHAFSPAYFRQNHSPARFFSYFRENCVPISRPADRVRPGPYIVSPLDDRGTGITETTVGELVRFLLDPARFFLRTRLVIGLEDDYAALQDNEPFSLNALDRYALGEALVAARVSGAPAENGLTMARALGILPHGAVGEEVYGDTEAEVESFFRRLERLTDVRSLRSVPVQIEFDGISMTGRIDRVGEEGAIGYRFVSGIRAKDALRLWIAHLAASTVRPLRRSTGLARDLCPLEFGPVDDPRGILQDMVGWMQEGLQRPLKFFPQTSWEYVETLMSTGDEDQAWKAAWGEWDRDARNGPPPEHLTPSVDLCFGNTRPLDEEFAEVSRALLEPLLNHRMQPSLAGK